MTHSGRELSCVRNSALFCSRVASAHSAAGGRPGVNVEQRAARRLADGVHHPIRLTSRGEERRESGTGHSECLSQSGEVRVAGPVRQQHSADSQSLIHERSVLYSTVQYRTVQYVFAVSLREVRHAFHHSTHRYFALSSLKSHSTASDRWSNITLSVIYTHILLIK